MKEYLKDPNSLQILDIQYSSIHNAIIYKFSANNSFGGAKTDYAAYADDRREIDFIVGTIEYSTILNETLDWDDIVNYYNLLNDTE